ncbi:MAG: hypothetical protein KatS3mg038_1439 [Candidatus Kapaibacterium sp.]|nr:MAG: hypothetical protein KatS3mg038_1439 [Candidatus Kapabacteria bacterium]
MIEVVESGGGTTSKGAAQIVCGTDGSRLSSHTGYAVSNGVHAVFHVNDSVLIIYYYQRRGTGKGTVFLCSDEGTRLPLFQFTDADDCGMTFHVTTVGDHSFAFPYLAARAAYRKARDYHCRRAYYALGNYAGGRSGPKGLGGGPSILKTGGLGYRPSTGDTP